MLDIRISGGTFSGNKGGTYGNFHIDAFYDDALELEDSLWQGQDKFDLCNFEFHIKIENHATFSNNIGGVRTFV